MPQHPLPWTHMDTVTDKMKQASAARMEAYIKGSENL